MDSFRTPTLPVLRRSDLLDSGLDDNAIYRMAARGEIHRVRHGAYADGPSWRTLDAAAQHVVAARAVLLQADSECVVSHTTAAVVLGAPTWGLDLSAVHVTRLDSRAGRREAGVVQHRGLLRTIDRIDVSGLPLTSAVRTAIDAVTILSAEAALVLVNDLLHRGLVTLSALVDAHRRLGHQPGSLRNQIVMRLADGRCESAAESRFLHLCFLAGLPKPEVQYEIRDDQGRLVARVDFAWPELGLFVEIDGKVKYQQHRRPGEDVVDTVLREKRREDEVRHITGWRCLRLTWADLENPVRTAELLRLALGGGSRRAS